MSWVFEVFDRKGLEVKMAASTWAAASTMAACGTAQRCMALPHQHLPVSTMMSSMASVGSPHAQLRLKSPDMRRGFWVASRANVAATEAAAAVAESPKLVEAPVSIVTGASRGIGKAIALALGGAGGKVARLYQSYLFIGEGFRGGCFVILMDIALF